MQSVLPNWHYIISKFCVGWKIQVVKKGNIFELHVTRLRSSEWTWSSVCLKTISYVTFFLLRLQNSSFCELRNRRLACFYDVTDWWRGNLEMESLNKRCVKVCFRWWWEPDGKCSTWLRCMFSLIFLLYLSALTITAVCPISALKLCYELSHR